MEFFIYWKIAIGLETLSSRVEYKMARVLESFVSIGILPTLNNEFMWSGNISNLESMSSFISTGEVIQWDKDNGCVYTIYTMSEM